MSSSECCGIVRAGLTQRTAHPSARRAESFATCNCASPSVEHQKLENVGSKHQTQVQILALCDFS